MSVMDMNSRMAMAEKLSVPQLQQAIQSGSLPAYIGIPLIEQKNKERSQMAAAQQGQQKPPSVASQILQQAEQGVAQLPSNLPEEGMAGGGIIAFAEGGDADDFDVEAYREQQDEDEYADALRSFMAASEAASQEGISSRRKKDKKYAAGGIAGLNEGGAIRFQNRGLVGDPDVLETMRIEDPEGYARVMREIPVAPASHATYVEPRLSVEQQAGMNDPMVDIGMGRTPDAGMPSTAPTLSPVVVTPENASPERSAPLETQKFPDEFAEEAASPGAGIDKLSSAKTVNPTVPGAPQGGTTPAASQAERPRSAYDDFLDEIRAGREDLKTQAQKDKYMALVSAGLGMMSGTSPNAFANIGQGAQAGIASYMASGKQRAAEKAALNKNLLMGRRYQSMEDIANRTADINERRIAAIAAARGSGGDSKSEAEFNRYERGLDARIAQQTDSINKQLKSEFGGETGIMLNQEKAAARRAILEQQKLQPLFKLQSEFLKKRYPEMFGNEDPAPSGGSSGTRLKVDKNGNIIQ